MLLDNFLAEDILTCMFLLFTVNSFFKQKEEFKNYFCYTKQLTRHKSFELEFTKHTFTFLELEIDLRTRGRDHAGVHVGGCLFGYTLSVRIYDHRHWDYENNKWQTYTSTDL